VLRYRQTDDSRARLCCHSGWAIRHRCDSVHTAVTVRVPYCDTVYPAVRARCQDSPAECYQAGASCQHVRLDSPDYVTQVNC
jgi:hypothetical protein